MNPTEQEKFEKWWIQPTNKHILADYSPCPNDVEIAARAAWLARAELAGEEKEELIPVNHPIIQAMWKQLEVVYGSGYQLCKDYQTLLEPTLPTVEDVQGIYKKAQPQSTEGDGGRKG